MGSSFRNVFTKNTRNWNLTSTFKLMLSIYLICAAVSPQRLESQSFQRKFRTNNENNSFKTTRQSPINRIQWLENPNSIAGLSNLFELVEKSVLQNRLMMDSDSVRKYLLRAGRGTQTPDTVLALFQFENLKTQSSIYLGIEYVLQDESKFEDPEIVDSLREAGGLGVRRLLQTPDLNEFRKMFGLSGVDILRNKTDMSQIEWSKVRHRYKQLNKRLYSKTYQEIKNSLVQQKLDRNFDRTETFSRIDSEIQKNGNKKGERKSLNKRVIEPKKSVENASDLESNTTSTSTSNENENVKESESEKESEKENVKESEKESDSGSFKVLHYRKGSLRSVNLDNLGLIKPVKTIIFNRKTGRFEIQIRNVKVVKPKAVPKPKTLPTKTEVLRPNPQLSNIKKLSKPIEIKQISKTKQQDEKKTQNSDISKTKTNILTLKSKPIKLPEESSENDLKTEAKLESEEEIRTPPKEFIFEKIETENTSTEQTENPVQENENQPSQNNDIGNAVLNNELSRLDEILARLSNNQKINPETEETEIAKTVPNINLPVLQKKDIPSLFQGDSPESQQQNSKTNFNDLSAFTKQDKIRNNTPKESVSLLIYIVSIYCAQIHIF